MTGWSAQTDLGRRLRIGDALALIVHKAGDPNSAITASLKAKSDEEKHLAMQREQDEALTHLSSVFRNR